MADLLERVNHEVSTALRGMPANDAPGRAMAWKRYTGLRSLAQKLTEALADFAC